MRVVTNSHAMVWYIQGSRRPSDNAAAALVDAVVSISRDALGDPWDRFIVAAAHALEIPIVTRERRIRKTNLVDVI